MRKHAVTPPIRPVSTALKPSKQGHSRVLAAWQTWANFMPLDSYPLTVDFQGPAGIPFARVRQVRYTWDSGNGLSISGPIEDDVGGNKVDSWGVSLGIDASLWEGGTILANYTTGDAISDILAFGLEYFTGTRTQGNGVEFDANRVQFAARFRF